MFWLVTFDEKMSDQEVSRRLMAAGASLLETSQRVPIGGSEASIEFEASKVQAEQLADAPWVIGVYPSSNLHTI